MQPPVGSLISEPTSRGGSLDVALVASALRSSGCVTGAGAAKWGSSLSYRGKAVDTFDAKAAGGLPSAFEDDACKPLKNGKRLHSPMLDFSRTATLTFVDPALESEFRSWHARQHWQVGKSEWVLSQGHKAQDQISFLCADTLLCTGLIAFACCLCEGALAHY